MANPSKYPPELLQSAAQFDPRIIDRMRKWQGHYGQGSRETQQLDQLIAEAQGGPQARLPEQVMFGAAQGNEQAANAVAAYDGRREQLLGELIGELDPAKFERWRAQQRAAAGALEGQLLNGPVAGALGARRQLLDALNARQ